MRFLLATDHASLAADFEGMLELLVGRVVLEVIHEDGRMALQRMESKTPMLAFLPLQMRGMEALTVLRRLGPDSSARVLVLTQDTVDGYRHAWECLRLGASDVLPLRGGTTPRLKGGRDVRVRQLAVHLAHLQAPWAERLPEIEAELQDRPWVVLPETRHLLSVSSWLRQQPRTFPVLLGLPEGPRFRRAAVEELARTARWPVRTLVHGDRLAPGQVHVFCEPDAPLVSGTAERWDAALVPTVWSGGPWHVRRALLEAMGRSKVPLGILLSDEPETIELDLLTRGETRVVSWIDGDESDRNPELPDSVSTLHAMLVPRSMRRTSRSMHPMTPPDLEEERRAA